MEKMNKRIIKSDYFYYFLMLFAVFTLLSLIIPRGFLSKFNLQSMAFQVPEFGILAIGMMITIITRGIDLSIISNANLSGIIAVITMKSLLMKNPDLSDPSIILIIIVFSILSGAVLGLVNGFFISFLRIPPILTTLGTMKLYDGISTVITGGQPITGFPPVISRISNETVGAVPISFIIFIAVLLCIYIVMERTPLGFSIYMYGENPTASRYSGEPIKSILMKTYLISGLMAGVAAVIMMSPVQLGKGRPTATPTCCRRYLWQYSEELPLKEEREKP